MRADASSWQNRPAPDTREDLAFAAEFTPAEAERLARGLVPRQMEDKWFVYFADGWLRFHRSWTGVFVYALRIEESPAGWRVAESWVSRDAAHYGGKDVEYDRRLVRFLIDALLLGRRDARFPMPAGSPAGPPGLVQHSIVGRAFPGTSGDEAESDDKS
jgi:hypothetical protein